MIIEKQINLPPEERIKLLKDFKKTDTEIQDYVGSPTKYFTKAMRYSEILLLTEQFPDNEKVGRVTETTKSKALIMFSHLRNKFDKNELYSLVTLQEWVTHNMNTTRLVVYKYLYALWKMGLIRRWRKYTKIARFKEGRWTRKGMWTHIHYQLSMEDNIFDEYAERYGLIDPTRDVRLEMLNERWNWTNRKIELINAIGRERFDQLYPKYLKANITDREINEVETAVATMENLDKLIEDKSIVPTYYEEFNKPNPIAK